MKQLEKILRANKAIILIPDLDTEGARCFKVRACDWSGESQKEVFKKVSFGRDYNLEEAIKICYNNLKEK